MAEQYTPGLPLGLGPINYGATRRPDPGVSAAPAFVPGALSPLGVLPFPLPPPAPQPSGPDWRDLASWVPPPPQPPVPLQGVGDLRTQPLSDTMAPTEAEAVDLARQGRELANVATTAAPFAVAGPLGVAGRGAVALATRFPRAATAAAGAAGLTAAPGQANEPDPLSVAQDTIARLRAAQGQLEVERTRLGAERLQFDKIDSGNKTAVAEAQRRLGLRPDGNWGPDTSKAIAAHKVNVERQLDTLDRQGTRLGKDLETQEDRLRGIERDMRVNEASRDMSLWDKMVRDYATPAGFVTGAAAGPAGRWAVTRGANAYRQSTVNRAEALVARQPRQVEQRVGNVNRFYSQGGAEPPFRIDPSAPRGFVPNASQAPANTLYPPGRQWRVGDTGAQAAFATETGFAHHQLQGAQQELSAARTAADREPSEANIRRVRDAEVNVGLMTFLERAGLGASVSYPLAATKLRYASPQPRVERAEAEVMRLNRLGSPPPPPPPARAQGGTRERWPAGSPNGLGGRFKGQ